MKISSIVAGVIAWTLISSSAAAQFVGNLELNPPGCQATGQCTLGSDLRYTDPNGLTWQAAAGNRTDGASIPFWAQPIVGAPFDESYIKAAVIHDHYCDRHVRSWRATHRVFYDALRELGVPPEKAKVMYYAVYLGGPKWIRLIPGRRCGETCVFRVEAPPPTQAEPVELALTREAAAAEAASASDTDGSSGVVTISREARYDEPGFAEELREVESMLQARGEEIDLDFLERRARDRRPNDFFYNNESEIEIEGGFSFR